MGGAVGRRVGKCNFHITSNVRAEGDGGRVKRSNFHILNVSAREWGKGWKCNLISSVRR